MKEIKIASDEELEKAMDKVCCEHQANLDDLSKIDNQKNDILGNRTILIKDKKTGFGIFFAPEVLKYLTVSEDKIIEYWGILPNETTINAMKEPREGAKRYETIEALMKDLENP